jgi:hypothetical protein
MADLTLGNKPLDIEVLLYAGYDFVDGIGRDDGTPWPEGSSLTLVLPSTGAKLRFVDGGSKLLWGQGKVKIG